MGEKMILRPVFPYLQKRIRIPLIGTDMIYLWRVPFGYTLTGRKKPWENRPKYIAFPFWDLSHRRNHPNGTRRRT